MPTILIFTTIFIARFKGPIGPVAADYLTGAIELAQDGSCLIIELDTPGGDDQSMREIIQAILNAQVPVCVYVYPSGARAASAGALILLASHIAAMAPGTNAGAAHPVQMFGEKIDSIMLEKVTNDAAAYAISLADRRGRNRRWAEDIVRKSISTPAREAVKIGAVDLLAGSETDLIEKLDGYEVKVDNEKKRITTRDEPIHRIPMSVKHKFLLILTNPGIVYFLLLIGIYGIFFELQNPGAIFPGVVGAIAFILFFYASRLLPINYAGVALIILAAILFILELQITSHGLLTVGGIIAFVLGSIMLFESDVPYLRTSISLIIFATVVTGLFFLLIVGLGIKAQFRKPQTGREGMVGLIGVAKTRIRPTGTVLVHGELWQAESDEVIKPGEKVIVVEMKEGMVLKVKKKA
ncbi:nodulation protein NfeD [candidate division WOR-3 bacterium]|uniref:Nodulation protein NfeD n=1 Tax=candidate division WOR-3 bacterium TaxID=2052148 RepID=A0A660SLZ2_UNCW3|nr:MAG: nodulation protein NfeD [candidate division WOR-3 bacterium]